MQVSEYERGLVDGLRRAVTLLHGEADKMNDPRARALFNSAAFGVSTLIYEAKRHRLPAAEGEDRA